MVSVAIAGASGYAGGEILRLLHRHPDVTIGALTAHSSVGSTLRDVQPQMSATGDLARQEIIETTAANLSGHDVVFLALPHGASGPIAAELGDDVLVIDVAADHRLESAEAWTEFYHSDHVGTWPYGMPELVRADGTKQRNDLRGAMRIAVPGCYPTAMTLALAPLVHHKLIDDQHIVVVAASGTSGAGKALKPHLLGSEVMGSMSPYGVGGVHRHTPEVEQNLRWAGGSGAPVSFTPTLAPMPRGILATCTAPVADGVTEVDLHRVLDTMYGDEPFINLLPRSQWPATAMTIGTNVIALQATLDERTQRAIVIAAVDNLTKGTAGAAVQCMNLALGFDETLGLPLIGVSP